MSNCKTIKRFAPKKTNKHDESLKCLIVGVIKMYVKQYFNEVGRDIIVPLSIYGLCLNYYTYKIGDIIDAKDCYGHWNLAEIRNHRSKNYALYSRRFYIYYFAFGDTPLDRKWDEWIEFKESVICQCFGKCTDDLHKIASANTQSQFKHYVDLKFEKGTKVDFKDKNDRWSCSSIINHKQLISSESVLIEWEEFDWDGWYLKRKWFKVRGIICNCKGVCTINNHRITAAYTQSRYDMIVNEIESLEKSQNKLAIF